MFIATHSVMCPNRGKGFHFKFTNGFTVSVQWGPENYCEGRVLFPSEEMKQEKSGFVSPDAEIAVWKGKQDVKLAENDTARGRLTPEQVAQIIFIVSTFSENSPLEYLEQKLWAI